MPNYRYQAQELQRRPSCGCRQPGRQIDRPVMERRERETGTAGRYLGGLPIAMAYVPWQEWRNILDVEKGFRCGTIFHELYQPFLGAGGKR